MTIGEAEAARFLLRAKFAAHDADIGSVRAMDYDAWLTREFAVPRGTSGADWLDAHGYDAVTEEARYFWPQAGDYMIWNQLLMQPDELRQRLAFALSQYFVVSLDPIDGFWPPYVMAGYWEVLASGVFGNFRDLLEAITLNAAMGMYLNTKGNLKEDPATGRAPDENYAREIMQLFTIGLHQLNPDGTVQQGADERPIESYSQADVTNLARVFTGYDHDYRRVTRRNVAWQNYPVVSTEFAADPMRLDEANHSTAEVRFLGAYIPEGTAGAEALQQALDHLFAHPNVGPFFGRQMIQRLVSSNPSPAYVARVAAAFDDNGAGVRGDLKAVWRAVLTDPEALAAPDPDDRLSGRLREPVQRFVGWARTVNFNPDQEHFEMFQTSRADEGLGQSPLRSPSVFNFYRPGYVPPRTAMAEAGTTAPEFQITTETSVAGYLNFLQWMTRWGVAAAKPGYTALMPIAHDPGAVTEWLNLRLAANQLDAATVDLISEALATLGVDADSDEERKLDLLASASVLVMATPEYLVLK